MRSRFWSLLVASMLAFSFPLVIALPASASGGGGLRPCTPEDTGYAVDIGGQTLCLPPLEENLHVGEVWTPAKAVGAGIAASGAQVVKSAVSACKGAPCVGLGLFTLSGIAWGYETALDWFSNALADLTNGTDGAAGVGTISNPCANALLPAIGSNLHTAVVVYQFVKPSYDNGECALSVTADALFSDPATGLLWRCSVSEPNGGLWSMKSTEPKTTSFWYAGAPCTAAPNHENLTLAYIKVTGLPISNPMFGGGGIFASPVEAGVIPSNPRGYRTETRCDYVDGSIETKVKETIGEAAALGCNPARSMVGGLVTVKTRVAANDPWIVIESWDLDATEDPQAALDYPACYVVQGGKQVNVCGTAVRVDGEACSPAHTYPASDPCYEWTRTRQDAPSRVDCKMGPYTMPSEFCNFLERAFQGIAVPNRQADLDGNPDTKTESPLPQLVPNRPPAPARQTQPTSTATATPTGTGLPTGTTSPSPSATATGTATGGGDPSPSPSGGPGSQGSPDPADQAGNECFPSGWGVFNPAEWVLKPVKCALTWAFVPPSTSWGDFWGTNKGRMEGSPIGGWAAVVGGFESAFAVGSGANGCQGPAVPTGVLASAIGTPIYPFDACSGVKATAAAASRIFLTVSIGWASAWRLVRIVGRPFGYSLDLMKER